MKITFPALFQTPLEKYTRYFIYGNDTTVFERTVIFLEHRLSLKRDIKTEGELLKSPRRLPSLFEDVSQRSLILVPQVTDVLLKHLDALSDDVFVFISDKARAQSKLVTTFAQDPAGLAISAYPSPLLRPEVDALTVDLSLSSDFKQELFKIYMNDYSGFLNTLEKIKLLGEDWEKYSPFILDSSGSSEDRTQILDDILLRNLQSLTQTLPKIQSTECIPLLRQLVRSFVTLLELMPFKTSPRTISWQSLGFPVFFKEQPRFESALSRWNSREILTFLDHLLLLEKAVKYDALTTSHFSHIILRTIAPSKCFT